MPVIVDVPHEVLINQMVMETTIIAHNTLQPKSNLTLADPCDSRLELLKESGIRFNTPTGT
jgi:hypothetical protein